MVAKGSNLLVAALENEGVTRIYGIPGEENLDVVEAIRCSSIELVLTRHEQAAAFMNRCLEFGFIDVHLERAKTGRRSTVSVVAGAP